MRKGKAAFPPKTAVAGLDKKIARCHFDLSRILKTCKFRQEREHGPRARHFSEPLSRLFPLYPLSLCLYPLRVTITVLRPTTNTVLAAQYHAHVFWRLSFIPYPLSFSRSPRSRHWHEEILVFWQADRLDCGQFLKLNRAGLRFRPRTR